MDDRLPLPALLSHVLVAFTIEFDNESERQIPHRTTNHGATPGALHAPWLVSLAMFENCMRFVGEEGVTVGALEKLARTATNLNGMERWGYITIAPNPADPRSKPPRRDWPIRATPAGRKAQELWRPLFGAIEQRWEARFGKAEIEHLRESLRTLIRQFDLDLPDCLPILGYGLFSKGPDGGQPPPAGLPPAGLPPAGPRPAGHTHAASPRLPISALLSRVLLAFAIEFERESELSLAICANVVRLLDEKGVRLRELPRLSGVSKELITSSVGLLAKRLYVVVEPDPTAKAAKLVRLTAKGREAQDAYRRRLAVIEERWLARFGIDAIRTLRDSLEHLVGVPSQSSPLFRGLEPYPDGWRASVPRPQVLPHYPMVTHRGAFPDGS